MKFEFSFRTGVFVGFALASVLSWAFNTKRSSIRSMPDECQNQNQLVTKSDTTHLKIRTYRIISLSQAQLHMYRDQNCKNTFNFLDVQD
jgi:hypothetical protein